jgi:hypothetical protein
MFFLVQGFEHYCAKLNNGGKCWLWAKAIGCKRLKEGKIFQKTEGIVINGVYYREKCIASLT